MMKPELYIARMSAPCRAVWMAIKALNIDVEIKDIDIAKKDHLKPEYVKLNPMSCVPTLKDGDFVMWESRPILVYLVTKYGGGNNPLYPNDPQQQAKILQMLSIDMGTIYKAITDFLFPQLFRQEKPTEAAKKYLDEKLKLLGQFIGDSPYVAGQSLTIADLSILGSVTFLEIKDYDLSPYPKVKAWVERLKKELPYFDECNAGLYGWKKALQAK